MDVASDKLINELRDIVAAAEELLGAAAGPDAGERLDEIRGRAGETLRAARARLEGVEQRLEDELRDQVRSHPLAALAIAAGVGLVLGLLLARK